MSDTITPKTLHIHLSYIVEIITITSDDSSDNL
jgi:hypothetical protein